MTLAEKVLALTRALQSIPHAFGGALALAYYAEPRATIDIDLNIFLPPDRFSDVAEHLAELGVEVSDPTTAEIIQRSGQVRVFWGSTPLDLFFAYDAFHDAAATSVQVVPFADSTIPILSAEHLIVCKAVFNRSKDWVDIESMLALGTVPDAAESLRWVARIAGDDDPRFNRLAAILTRPTPRHG